ncbi:MAG: hypothetical protein RIE52_14725 [Balneola sp.]|jgi:hypothetical protein
MSNKNKIERELKQKEFESEIERDLRKQELDREYEEKLDSDYHPAALFAIRFFGNLMIGFVFYMIFNWLGGRQISMISPEIANGIKTIIHVTIVGIALIGAITKKSPWERLIR